MQNVLKGKISKIALVGALALGGLAGAEVINLDKTQVAHANTSSEVKDFYATYQSSGINSLRTYVHVDSVYGTIDDFSYKHNARYTIQNSSGTIVQSGSLNYWNTYDPEPGTHWQSVTNISTANIGTGHFRINITIPMDDKTVTKAHDSSLTQHFYKDSAGNLSQFSQ